jgi:hypothetical protein
VGNLSSEVDQLREKNDWGRPGTKIMAKLNRYKVYSYW